MPTEKLSSVSTFDDLLVLIGFGNFTNFLFLACSSWGLFGSMNLISTVFLVPYQAEFECHVRELDSANWTIEEKRNFSIPWNNQEGYSKCFYFKRNYSNFVSLKFNESVFMTSEFGGEVKACSHWTHITKETLISEWDLVCDREYLRPFVQIFFMLGVLISALIGGYLADKCGRIRLIRGGFVLYVASGLVSAFAISFEMFLAYRFIVAMSGNFVYLTSYILMIEWCFPKYRGIYGLIYSVPFALGYMLLPIIAMWSKSWRSLLQIISGATCFLVGNFLIMVESPRWLILNGRIDEAVKVVNFARKMNGKPGFKDQELKQAFFQVLKTSKSLSPSETRSRSSVNCCNCLISWLPFVKREMKDVEETKRIHQSNIVSRKIIKFCILLTFNWLVANLVYYGLSLNAGNLGVDPYIYIFVGGLLEIPCYTVIVPFVYKIGRKKPLIFFFGVSGGSVLSTLLLNKETGFLGFLILNLIAKLTITSAFQLLYLYTSEIFPTNFRTTGVSITSMIGRVGSVISPFFTDSVGPKHWKLPVLVFGCSSIAACITTLFLPETCSKSLPETVNDVETLNTQTRRVSKSEEGTDEEVEALSND